jgi:nucleotide-binding universal stress UspA family protein
MFTLRRVLVPTDFSPCADRAVRHGAFLARQYGAALTLAHVVPVAPSYPLAGVAAADTENAEEVRSRLDDVIAEHELGDLDVDCLVERSEEGVGAAVIDAAERCDADLITLGTHGRKGVRRLVVGSEAEEVIRGADRPVLAVRHPEGKGEEGEPDAGEPHAINRLLVPVDLSEHSRGAYAHAVELARKYDADLHLLHVVQPTPDYELPGVYQASLPPQTDVVDALTENAHDELGDLLDQATLPAARLHKDVRHGDPASEIIDTAAEIGADMIVLASHGRTGLERFLMGSVAEKTIRSTPCPVFVVKAYGRSLVG